MGGNMKRTVGALAVIEPNQLLQRKIKWLVTIHLMLYIFLAVVSLSHTRTHTHTDTKTQHSSLLIAFCSLHTTQLHGQIESALIFLHFFFLPNLLFFCNSKLYSGSHSGGQLTPTIFRLQPPVSEPTWKQSVLKAGWQVSVKERRWIGHSRDWLHRPIGQVNVTRHPPLPPCCNG